MSVLVYEHTIPWWNNITARFKYRTWQNPSANGHATIEDKEIAAVIPRYTKLPKQVFTSDCRGMWNGMYHTVFEKAKIKGNRDVSSG